MQELLNSFVRLSAAMTVYSMQQMQSAVETIDPKESVNKLRQMIDSMTDALTAQIDERKKPTVESISKVGSDVVDRTFDTLNAAASAPRDIVQTTGDIVKKTTDSLSNFMGTTEKKTAGEPVSAESVLV
jgi:hypothetical protein